MLNQEIINNRHKKDNLLNDLNQINSILLAKHQELSELLIDQQDNLQDQCTRIEQNLQFMQKKVEEINTFCKEKLEDKKGIMSNIKKYTEKKQALSNIFQSQNKKLQEAKTVNSQIEEEIKLSRMQYEELQDEVFNLDIKNQNLKKFGIEAVPQDFANIIAKKEELMLRNKELDKRLQAERPGVDKMYSRNQKEKIINEIKQLYRRGQTMDQLIEEIRQLQVQNEELTKVKSEYQWNPNLQIKQLQLNEQEQQHKINNIEKEIAILRKKSTEYLQKIQMYKNQQQKHESFKRQGLNSPQKAQLKERNEKVNPTKIYSDIKRELEMESQNKDASILQRIRLSFKGNGQQSNQTIILDERTYRINKKINLISFWILVILLLIGLYFNHKTHKK